jgi:4-amino-4-deoxy-L-arabinose transferase-like glycosyltransferase
VFLTRLIGVDLAFAASAIMATVPLFALKATIPSADAPELFFVATSVWLFWLSMQRDRRFWLLFIAGASVALAFSAHEVSGALIIAYGVLFLAGFGIPRGQYWIMALGFFSIIAAESLYYLVVVGDPFYRLALVFKVTVAGGGDRVPVGVLQIAPGGTLHVHEWLDPLLMFFTQPNFGLLGFVAVPALWWSCVTMHHDRSLPLVTARLMALVAVVWFLFAAILLRKAILIPRYYMVVAYFLFVIIVLWATLYLWPRRRKLVLSLAGLLVTVNLLSIAFDEKNPRYGERVLMKYLAESEGPVGVDPQTAARGELFCRWSGVDCARIMPGPPDPGRALNYFYYAPNASNLNRLVTTRQDLDQYIPEPGWQVVWQHAEAESRIAGVLRGLGIDRVLPASLYRKLAGQNRHVVVYQLPANG